MNPYVSVIPLGVSDLNRVKQMYSEGLGWPISQDYPDWWTADRCRDRADEGESMDITIHASLLPHNDPDASLAFYRDTLGFEVRNDIAFGMRCNMVGPANQPGTSIPGLPVRLQARQDTPGRCDP